MGKDGNITRCARCGFTYHLVKDCSEKEFNKNSAMSATTDEEVTSANVSVVYAELTDVLLRECFGMGIMDTACTATIYGTEW